MTVMLVGEKPESGLGLGGAGGSIKCGEIVSAHPLNYILYVHTCTYIYACITV